MPPLPQRIDINDSILTVPMAPLPSPGTASADVLGAAQQGAQQTYEALDKRAQQVGSLKAANNVAKAHLEITKEMDQLHDSGQVGEGFVQQMDERLTQRITDLRAQAAESNNPYETQALEAALPELGQLTYTRAHTMEAAANVAAQENLMGDTFNTWTNAVRLNPSLYANAKASLEKTINEARLPAERKEAWRARLGEVAQEVILAAPPEIGLKMINSPQFAAEVTPDQRRAIENYFHAQQAHSYTQFEHNWHADQRARETNSLETETEINKRLAAGDEQGARAVAAQAIQNGTMDIPAQRRTMATFNLGRTGPGDLATEQSIQDMILNGQIEQAKKARNAGISAGTIDSPAFERLGRLLDNNVAAPWSKQGKDAIDDLAAAATTKTRSTMEQQAIAKRKLEANYAWQQWVTEHQNAPLGEAEKMSRHLANYAAGKDWQTPAPVGTIRTANGKGPIDFVNSQTALINKYHAKYREPPDGKVTAAVARDKNFQKELHQLRNAIEQEQLNESLNERGLIVPRATGGFTPTQPTAPQ